MYYIKDGYLALGHHNHNKTNKKRAENIDEISNIISDQAKAVLKNGFGYRHEREIESKKFTFRESLKFEVLALMNTHILWEIYSYLSDYLRDKISEDIGVKNLKEYVENLINEIEGGGYPEEKLNHLITALEKSIYGENASAVWLTSTEKEALCYVSEYDDENIIKVSIGNSPFLISDLGEEGIFIVLGKE